MSQVKTPKFNSALYKILESLLPHERSCAKCKSVFQITSEDIEYLKLLDVPPPTLCPSCRLRRRRAFANYTTLYKRSCSAPDHSESIISQIPGDTSFPVYDSGYYWSESWDAMSYGFSVKEDEPFLSQMGRLLRVVPQPQTTRDPRSVNSDYTSYGLQNKNCYYVFGGSRSEDVMYSHWPIETKDSIDCLVPWQSERCYELMFSEYCYNSDFLWFSKNCVDCTFLYDCRGCESCFGCVNLRNKKYFFFNEFLGKEEYLKRISEVNLGSFENLSYWKHKFFSFSNEVFKRAIFNEKNVNSDGFYLDNCRNCIFGFFQRMSENCRYTDMNVFVKETMDVSFGMGASLSYDAVMPYDGVGIKFCALTRNKCIDVEYSMNMSNCEYCFGCVGLVKKRFCILNKQFKEEEYWSIVDEIKTKMLVSGEYGEMLELSFSPFPYNASLAAISHPRTEEELKSEGLYYVDSAPMKIDVNVIEAEDLPDAITEISDEMTNRAIRCEKSGKLFRVTPQEISFYRRENLALPRVSPYARIVRRLKDLGFLGFTRTRCVRCGGITSFNEQSTFDKTFICEGCFKAEVG